MVFITIPYVKNTTITFEDLLDGKADLKFYNNSQDNGNTRTFCVKYPSDTMFQKVNIQMFINKLADFNRRYASLFGVDIKTLYNTFHIPKKSGGFRTIDEPMGELMTALRDLKKIFEEECVATHHTNAHAYVKGRSALSAVKRHQRNESKWILKTDLANFFGSTTPEFVEKMLRSVFPFSEIYKRPYGEEQLTRALSLCFLNGGLPQGTPMSPLLTNLIMIPFDWYMANTLKDYNGNHYVYTRYADDIDISCRVSFKFTDIVDVISGILLDLGAPYTIKKEKTHYGSSAGRNWILGVMLNKDNEITIGHERKKRLKSELSHFIVDNLNGKPWSVEEAQSFQGRLSYFRSVEPEKCDHMLKTYDKKFGVNIASLLKANINAALA